MFAFLKGLFQKKTSEPVAVSVHELSGWLDGQIDERVKDLDGTVQEFTSSVTRLRQQLREQREALLAAALVDEDSIEPRVKNIVLGHRTNYCRELALFLNELSIPEQTALSSGRELSSSLNVALDSFAQKTVKSFGATRHLFHAEVDPVADSLRELSEAAKSFEQVLAGKGIFTFDQLKERVKQLQRTYDQKARLSEDLLVKQQRLENAQKQRLQKEQHVAEIKESSDFKAYSELLSKHEAFTKSSADVERDITKFFIEIDRPLRKYAHRAADDERAVVTQYLDNPKSALAEDASFRIVSVLSHLREQMDSLELKDDEKKRLTAALAGVDSALRSFREWLLRLKEEKTALSRKLEGNPAFTHLQEAEYRLAHFNEQVERFTKEIAVNIEAIGGLSVEEPLRALEKDISGALNVPVTIAPSA